MRALFVWQSFQVGVEVSKGTGRFLRTKVVRFVPRFEINNTTDRQLLVCQHQQPFTVLGHVPAKQTAPYHFPDLRVGALLKLKFGSDAAWAWSTPFGVADPGTVYVKMRRSYGAVEIARVDVRLNGATTHGQPRAQLQHSKHCFQPSNGVGPHSGPYCKHSMINNNNDEVILVI